MAHQQAARVAVDVVEPGRGERLPEAVAGAGEGHAGVGGVEARVEAAHQEAHAGGHGVGEGAQAGGREGDPGGLALGDRDVVDAEARTDHHVGEALGVPPGEVAAGEVVVARRLALAREDEQVEAPADVEHPSQLAEHQRERAGSTCWRHLLAQMPPNDPVRNGSSSKSAATPGTCRWRRRASTSIAGGGVERDHRRAQQPEVVAGAAAQVQAAGAPGVTAAANRSARPGSCAVRFAR